MDISRIFSACLLFVGLFIVACQDDDQCTRGSGEVVTRDVDVQSFTAISNSSFVDISIGANTQQAISVTAEDNIIDEIQFDFSDAILTIGDNLDCVSTNQEATAEVASSELTQVINSGNGDMRGTPDLSNAEIINSGNGDISFQGDEVASLTIISSSNGDVTIGHTITLEANVGNSGNGDIYVTVEGILDVAISGNGDVYYTGSPSSVSATITGNGELIDNN
jgi:hypothetical protein